MKRPPMRPGAFSLVSKMGLKSELGHQLPFGQGNDGYRPPRRGITSWNGRKSASLPRRYRHGHGAGGLPQSFANQLHTAAHAELREQRGDVKFYGAFGKIQVGGDFLVGEALQQSAENFFLPARQIHLPAD